MEKAFSIEDIKQGYTYDKHTQTYSCNFCSKKYEKGEIYKNGDRFFEADKIIKIHIAQEHGDMFSLLNSYDKKYLGITDNQKELLKMIYSGMTDNEIAIQNGISSSTVRHQRFTFKEKAKQAKNFLALYELAVEGAENNKNNIDINSQFVDVHSNAKMVDDRYFVTKAEEDLIIKAMFSSTEPLKLKTFSSKEKKKIVILKKICEQLDRNKHYNEKELNSIIKSIYDDYATIRRYLIEYGFMERTNDCMEYWVK